MIEPHAGLLAERRKRAQEVPRVLVDDLDRPAGGRPRAHREIADVDVAADDEIVVAGQAPLDDVTDECRAGVRVRAVADDVAQAPDLVVILSSEVR